MKKKIIMKAFGLYLSQEMYLERNKHQLKQLENYIIKTCEENNLDGNHVMNIFVRYLSMSGAPL